MEVVLTLMIQCSISAEDESDYEEKRDNIILSLEKKGVCVNIENEESDDFDDYQEDEDD